MTLIEAGWYIDPELEPLERLAPAGPSRPNGDNSQDGLTPDPPAAKSAYHETLAVLERLAQAIDSTLNRKERGGRRVKLHRYVLAWEVHDAMRQHLTVQPTSTTGGKFEKLLEACMLAGLTTIGATKQLPRDFRTHMRWAIRVRRHAAGTKPIPK
jgi:hypothetical protein